MRKYVICGAAVLLLAGGFLAGRMLLREYNPAGAPDPSDMLVMEEDTEGFAFIEDDSVPLSDGLNPAGEGSAEENPYVQQVIDLVNEERARAGLSPLSKSSEICRAADIRATEIVQSFSHTRPDGRRYRTVLTDCGIQTRSSGENIAGGYRSPQEVVQAWMGSEGHRANILNPDYTEIGVGCSRGGSMQYWCQLFAY